MSAFLLASDDRWKYPQDQVVELVSSSANDPDLVGVGGDPWVGSLGRTGIAVPAAATTNPIGPAQANRYLLRLCGVQIPSGYAIRIRGLRQLATIRATDTTQPDGQIVIVEREIVSPLWSFFDGNISWHLRHQKNQFAPRGFDAVPVAGASPEMRGLDTALLYIPPIVPYTALGAGIPPGNGIGTLGTWRDMRFPWELQDSTSMSTLVKGPGDVVFYASVHQTDPDNRPPYPDVDGMRPEDRFVSNFQTSARYGRVAGALIVELLSAPEEKLR